MLALDIRGLVEVVDGLSLPWRHLVEALLLALLALAFVAAAARSPAHRFGWLLFASTAAGLAAAAGYRFAQYRSARDDHCDPGFACCSSPRMALCVRLMVNRIVVVDDRRARATRRFATAGAGDWSVEPLLIA